MIKITGYPAAGNGIELAVLAHNNGLNISAIEPRCASTVLKITAMRTLDHENKGFTPMNATHLAKPPTPVKRTVSRGRLPNAQSGMVSERPN
jgi:hypothetical protein